MPDFMSTACDSMRHVIIVTLAHPVWTLHLWIIWHITHRPCLSPARTTAVFLVLTFRSFSALFLAAAKLTNSHLMSACSFKFVFCIV